MRQPCEKTFAYCYINAYICSAIKARDHLTKHLDATFSYDVVKISFVIRIKNLLFFLTFVNNLNDFQ